MDKDNQDIFKNSFDDIFSEGGLPEKLENTEDIQNMMSPNKETKPFVDYNARRTRLYNKAKSTIDALLKFYLDESIITENEYFKQKAVQDQSTLGDIMNQIEISNSYINTLMETIDRGDISPRFFEVLSDSQKTFIELLKMKTNFIIQMEETTKKLISDREMYASEKTRKELQQGSVSTRGAKGLMQNIQEIIDNSEDIEDVNEITN